MPLVAEAPPTWPSYEAASRRHAEAGFRQPGDKVGHRDVAADLAESMQRHLAYCATNGKWAPPWFPGVLWAHRNYLVRLPA